MTGRSPKRSSNPSAAGSGAGNSTPRLIFACNLILDNENVPEYQRARLLTQNFRTAILYRSTIPDTIRDECQETYRLRGRILSVLHGFLLILYLRVVGGYRTLYTSPETFSMIWGSLAKSLLGCKWIYDLWDHPSLEFARGRPFVTAAKKLLYCAFLRRRLADADGWVVAMHKGVLDHMPKPYPERKIVQITNGVDLTLIDGILGDKVETLESRDTRSLKVCYAGPVTMLRGMSILLQCLDSLGPEYSIEVNLIGRSDDEVLEAIENHNRSSPHKVLYHGYLPHEEALIKLAESEVCLCILDPSVLSYRYSYNVKIFEYLALGKVVAASRTAAFAEIIEDGRNGFLISYNAEGLKSVFDKVFDMKKRGDLVRVKRAARETARFYLWEDINDKMLSGLQTLLRNP